MRTIENVLISLIIIFLSIHLFTIHSKLLFHLNPDNIVEYLNYKFSLDLFREDLIVPTLSALSYSLITAFMLTVFVKYKNVFLVTVISFAILDAIGVFVYYNIKINEDMFIIIGAIYYSLYTMFIIISVGMYRNYIYKDEGLNKNIDNAILENDVIQLRDNMNNIMNKKYPTLDEKVLYLYNQTEPKLSQQKIAKKLSISQPMVSRILAKYKDEK